MSLDVSVRHRLGGFGLDVAFATGPGVTVLFGRSGAGKSTLAALVCGLMRPDEGRIVLDGRVLADRAGRVHVPPRSRRIGVVFQEGRLFPHLSVRQNLTFGRRSAPRGERWADMDRVVDLLGIGPLLGRRPRHLSGGERQRVAIGRALLMSPRALVMDEPLAALDEARKAEILPFIERVRDEVAIPILYISHAVAEVTRLAATVVVLDAGRVAAVGTPADVLAAPAVAPALAHGDAAAVLTARVARHHVADGLTELVAAAGPLLVPAIAAAEGTVARVRIGARDVIIARDRPAGLSALNIIPAVVTALRETPGAAVEVTLDAAGDRLLARITRRSREALALREGEAVFAVLKSLAVDPASIGRGIG